MSQIRMATLINMPKFNGIELGKVMADTRRTAFRPVHETMDGYTETPPESKRAQFAGGGDVAPETGVMTSGAEAIDASKTEQLFKAMKLDKTKLDQASFHAGINAELEKNPNANGNLKKIALLVVARLAIDPNQYAPEGGPAPETPNISRMSDMIGR